MTARMRALQAIAAAGLGEVRELERIPNTANEVWTAGPYVVRVSSSPGSKRLLYESQIAAALPPEVRYPAIVEYGRSDAVEWLIVERVPGEPLSRAWPALSTEQRRAATFTLADALRALHATAPPADLVPPFARDSLECPHQLPPHRLVELLGRAAELPHLDRGVLEAASALVTDLGGALDDTGPPRLVHGDMHFENVLWNGHRITALVDFEFCRAGPADLDLDVLLRFVADPALHVARDYEHLVDRNDYLEVPDWLRESYPELFAHPRLDDRLIVYGLAYDVRNLLLHPPAGPPGSLPPFHPWNRIRKTVANPHQV
jgi:hygromycin-B 7''-O-kinase